MDGALARVYQGPESNRGQLQRHRASLLITS
jgi:hypothetical protein